MAQIRPCRAPRRLLRGAILVLAGAGILSGGGVSGMAERRGAALAPHRDGNVAVAEELEGARRAGTIAAYDLFLARHPDHKLARTARRERRLIVERLRRPN